MQKVSKCVVPEYIHTCTCTTMEGIVNSEGEEGWGGGGGSKTKEIAEGRGLYDQFSFQRSFD